MIKIFSLVLDLLELPFWPGHISLAEKIIENPNYKIISFCSYWFLYFAFQDFLLEKISQEDFIALGDDFGKLYDYQNNPIFVKESLVYWLKNEVNQYANSLIVFPKEDKKYLEKMIPSLIKILDDIKSQIFYV